ncbi:MAG TPA: OsmC family protein [Steroidobacteraceae bacterium]|nr:OsmC family protein [Steroidobacteraceae bacterium]HUA23659.1 OsmC family protein [Steroidobacteraceae bacterium]
MRSSPFDSAVAGRSVLITETGMEPLQLLGRVGSTSFVVADARRPYCPESLNPYELMGAALGSCTAMILRLHADLMGIAIGRIQVSVSHHSGYPETMALFERTIILEGSISADDKLRLMEAAQRGPVDLSLRGGAEIRTTICTEDCLAAPPATSDYLSDITQAVAGTQATFSHAD